MRCNWNGWTTILLGQNAPKVDSSYYRKFKSICSNFEGSNYNYRQGKIGKKEIAHAEREQINGENKEFSQVEGKSLKIGPKNFQENNQTVNFDCSPKTSRQEVGKTGKKQESFTWKRTQFPFPVPESQGICESLKTGFKKRRKKIERQRRYLSTWRDTGSRERRRRLVNWVDYRQVLNGFLQPENQEDHGAGNRHRRRQNHSLRGQRGSHTS